MTKKIKTIPCKWLKSGISLGFSYQAGDICQLETKQANELKNSGFVELLEIITEEID